MGTTIDKGRLTITIGHRLIRTIDVGEERSINMNSQFRSNGTVNGMNDRFIRAKGSDERTPMEMDDR